MCIEHSIKFGSCIFFMQDVIIIFSWLGHLEWVGGSSYIPNPVGFTKIVLSTPFLRCVWCILSFESWQYSHIQVTDPHCTDIFFILYVKLVQQLKILSWPAVGWCRILFQRPLYPPLSVNDIGSCCRLCRCLKPLFHCCPSQYDGRDWDGLWKIGLLLQVHTADHQGGFHFFFKIINNSWA